MPAYGSSGRDQKSPLKPSEDSETRGNTMEILEKNWVVKEQNWQYIYIKWLKATDKKEKLASFQGSTHTKEQFCFQSLKIYLKDFPILGLLSHILAF